ncbi:H0502G05.11 protein, putative [Theobroma cacao]|uniref:H0502G05.11 protein, putative n=1 Tax=Theobroma cacao TaxID=3641 RepID=A0A061DLW3_THECC|nr:H0502G05.11 protein, putative [Theobroma cacao]
MVETIAQFSSSTATTYLPQPMLTHNGENVVNVVNNKNENGRNGNNKIDPLLNTTNPSINKSLNFLEFNLKLSYPTKVPTKSYPKDYTTPKFKRFNRKTDDAREYVMRRQDEEIVAPFPFSAPLDRVKALLQKWIRDEQINLPYVLRPLIVEEKSNPHYCDYHHVVGHPFAESKNMHKIFHKRT